MHTSSAIFIEAILKRSLFSYTIYSVVFAVLLVTLGCHQSAQPQNRSDPRISQPLKSPSTNIIREIRKHQFKALDVTDDISLPGNWKPVSITEPFSSAATELEKRLPTSIKAKIRFEAGMHEWMEVYVSTALWSSEDVDAYNRHLQKRMMYAMRMPYYLGQSGKLRFMFLDGANCQSLIDHFRSMNTSTQKGEGL